MIAPDVTYLIAMSITALSVLFAAALLSLDLVPAALDRWFDRAGRRRLRHALQELRFARMLELRRLPLREFVGRLDPQRVQRAVDNCRSCSNASRCEAVLRGYLPAGDYGFCPNREAVTQALQLRVR